MIDAFERAGVHALLLKGPSISQWLYTDGTERPYVDCDVLVGPSDFGAAQEALASLGYTPLRDRWGLPAWWQGHAVPWTRGGGGVWVDLHRTLIGVGADPATTWGVLSAGAAEVVVAGRRVASLGLPARAMHLALHAAQHGPGTRPVADLERALSLADDELWVGAAGLAGRLDATAAFVAGLRLARSGERLISRQALPDQRSVGVELRAAAPPPLALGFERLAQARTMRSRAEIVWRNLAPGGLRPAWGPTGGASGRGGSALPYLRRLAWLARPHRLGSRRGIACTDRCRAGELAAGVTPSDRREVEHRLE